MTIETIHKIHSEFTIEEKSYPCEIWIEFITPERAAELLNATVGNRRTMRSHLNRIIHAMNTNKFDELGDPIHISNTNLTLNGHHRLQGIVKTGKGYLFVIVRGLPESAFHNLDQSKPRTGADTLKVAGYANSSELAAVIKCIIRLQQRIDTAQSPSNMEVHYGAECHAGLPELTDNELQKKYMKDAQITRDRIGIIPFPAVTALYYIYGTADSEKYDQFIEGLNFNKGVVDHATDTKHPITVLEKKIRSESAKIISSPNRKAQGLAVSEHIAYYAWFHKAWEKFLAGKTMSSRDFVESEKTEVLARLFTYTEATLGAFVID